MKVIDREALECVAKKFLKLPNIQKYEVDEKTEDGFTASVEMDDGFEFKIYAYVLPTVYPSTILQLIEKKRMDEGIPVLVSSYISDRTAQICEKNQMGYFDYAGNCWFVGHSIYLSERGNKNLQPLQSKTVSIFERSAVVSSFILREILADTKRVWKLKHLSEKVNCSIGQVSKVMNFLVQNAWAVKTKDGYSLLEPESILKEWSRVYGKKERTSYGCYTLENLSTFESKLKALKRETGIDGYLTGFAGGVRYAPVVRYNRVHLYIAPEDIREAIEYLELKEVDSGFNVVIFPLESEAYIVGNQLIGENAIVSPLQIYLDCMQLKGRGEEMAEAILQKEILR